MDYDVNRLFNNAVAAYFRRLGSNAPQPSNTSGVEYINGQDCFILRNCNGLLAIYKIINGDRLRFVITK